jgi:hypothetical protein
MGRYCDDCDYKLNEELKSRNYDGCACDLSKWHKEDPIKDGEYITREISLSSGGDISINKRWFRNKDWVGLDRTPWSEHEDVISWIEEENYKPYEEEKE